MSGGYEPAVHASAGRFGFAPVISLKPS